MTLEATNGPLPGKKSNSSPGHHEVKRSKLLYIEKNDFIIILYADNQ